MPPKKKPEPEYLPSFQTLLYVDLYVRECIWHLEQVCLRTVFKPDAPDNIHKYIIDGLYRIRKIRLHLEVLETQFHFLNLPTTVFHLVNGSAHEYAEWLLQIVDHIGQWDEPKESDQ